MVMICSAVVVTRPSLVATFLGNSIAVSTYIGDLPCCSGDLSCCSGDLGTRPGLVITYFGNSRGLLPFFMVACPVVVVI